jgi:undecaprenyl-diphosphatase
MNLAIFQYLNHFTGQFFWLDTLIIFFGQYFGYLLMAGLALFVVFAKERKREAMMVFYSLAAAAVSRLVITEIIRYFYHSPRPFMILNFTPLIYDNASSFPSGHAAFFFALAAAVFLFHKKWGIAYFLGTLIISLCRIMAGIHWPTDILGGFLVGIISAVLIYYFFQKRINLVNG